MHSEYITALETRAAWVEIVRLRTKALFAAGMSADQKAEMDRVSPFIDGLTNGDTYFMNSKFCGLVEHAKDCMPDALAFEMSWFHTECGWLWLETPYEITNATVPHPIPVAAVAWMPNDANKVLFASYYAAPNGGFECVATVGFGQGDLLKDTLLKYTNDPMTQPYLRWVYAAFHLMAQKLTHTSTVETDRNTRRRGERTKRPVTPSIRIVSLRRQEQARAAAGVAGQARDWQWQWSVRGHWRKQYYAATKTYKQIFIEAFFKGPKDRPIKPPMHTLFVAGR